VRVAVAVLGIESTSARSSRTFAFLSPPHSVDHQGLGDDRRDRHARVERRVRVLENDLHALAIPAQIAIGDRQQIDAVELDRARRGLDEAQHAATDRRLARTRLPHQPERATLGEIERHTRDGLHDDLAATAAHRKMLDEVGAPREIAPPPSPFRSRNVSAK